MEQSIEELPSYIAIDLITSNRTDSVHFETSLVYRNCKWFCRTNFRLF